MDDPKDARNQDDLARSCSQEELDAAYAAYDEHPIDEPDEWGDLASFRAAAAES